MRPFNTVLEWWEESASVYSKSVCEGKCTGVLHLQENVRSLIFKKQGTDRFLAFFNIRNGDRPVLLAVFLK